MEKKLKKLLLILICVVSVQAFAQNRSISGQVVDGSGVPLPGVSVYIKNSNTGTNTNFDGNFSLRVPNDEEAIVVFSSIGFTTQEMALGTKTEFMVTMTVDEESLDQVVVTALGIKQEKKALAYSVTEVKGSVIAETQRENFIDGLAGRVAGVEINSTSGLPGSSTSIVIRGISSLSGNNQPLFVVDGLPISNATMSTNMLASRGGATSFENRGIDFTNRAADINPEDIAAITILKGPEASALYGIEAASGAVVITTKRGQAGKARIDYSNSFRQDQIIRYPETQRIYDRGENGFTVDGDDNLNYFGAEYPQGTQFYDNVKNFFRNASTQRHNISFSGGTENNQYRISASNTSSEGFIPTTGLEKLNITSAITATLNKYIAADVTFDYTRSDNDQTFRGTNGPLLDLLRWPSTDDASVYLTPSGERRNYATFSDADDVENPFFNVNSNILNSLTDRYKLNTKLNITPTDWLRFVGQVGVDYFTTKTTIVRHPESNTGKSFGGVFDQSLATTRNLTFQSYLQITPKKFFNGLLDTDLKVGTAIYDYNTFSASVTGQDFQAPDLWSINNTDLSTHRAFNNLIQRRLVGVFGTFNASYDNMLYLTLTARKDWSSTLPKKNNSFFYPSAGLSFIFTELEAFKGFKDVLSFGKLRASVAQVGKDANPYSIRPFYENALTTGGGFRYGFSGPSFNLVPEITTSYEYGFELRFFGNRLGLDATYYNKKSEDQIVQNLRLSYGTGFVLSTFNAGAIQNEGIELQLNATPIETGDFSWDILANYTKNWSELVSLPGDVTEFYNSDTWLYGNVRSGARVGGALTTFTGYDFEKNDAGEVLINPSNGLPLLDTTEWVVVGDRNPDFTMGLTNTFRYKDFSLNFLLDFRVGGDVYNATEHYLTTRGLSLRTLDRETPRIVDGVLKDGRENSGDPTQNNIPIDLARNSTYWSSIYPHQNFIEKDINWVRLRDVTVSYSLSRELLQKIKGLEQASIFVTGTDLFILTNYSGLDPVGNANSAAVGGAGGYGFDYGNFPVPMGINLGVRVGF